MVWQTDAFALATSYEEETGCYIGLWIPGDKQVTWSTEDGTTFLCQGAGTPFRAGTDPTASSPECGHTYRISSAGQTGQEFSVTATVRWTITWAGAGQGGTFPNMTTTANSAFRVAEIQALNNDSG